MVGFETVFRHQIGWETRSALNSVRNVTEWAEKRDLLQNVTKKDIEYATKQDLLQNLSENVTESLKYDNYFKMSENVTKSLREKMR